MPTDQPRPSTKLSPLAQPELGALLITIADFLPIDVLLVGQRVSRHFNQVMSHNAVWKNRFEQQQLGSLGKCFLAPNFDSSENALRAYFTKLMPDSNGGYEQVINDNKDFIAFFNLSTTDFTNQLLALHQSAKWLNDEGYYSQQDKQFRFDKPLAYQFATQYAYLSGKFQSVLVSIELQRKVSSQDLFNNTDLAPILLSFPADIQVTFKEFILRDAYHFCILRGRSIICQLELNYEPKDDHYRPPELRRKVYDDSLEAISQVFSTATLADAKQIVNLRLQDKLKSEYFNSCLIGYLPYQIKSCIKSYSTVPNALSIKDSYFIQNTPARLLIQQQTDTTQLLDTDSNFYRWLVSLNKTSVNLIIKTLLEYTLEAHKKKLVWRILRNFELLKLVNTDIYQKCLGRLNETDRKKLINSNSFTQFLEQREDQYSLLLELHQSQPQMSISYLFNLRYLWQYDLVCAKFPMAAAFFKNTVPQAQLKAPAELLTEAHAATNEQQALIRLKAIKNVNLCISPYSSNKSRQQLLSLAIRKFNFAEIIISSQPLSKLLTPTDFRKIARKHPQTAQLILKHAAKRLDTPDKDILTYGVSLKSKLAGLLMGGIWYTSISLLTLPITLVSAPSSMLVLARTFLSDQCYFSSSSIANTLINATIAAALPLLTPLIYLLNLPISFAMGCYHGWRLGLEQMLKIPLKAAQFLAEGHQIAWQHKLIKVAGISLLGILTPAYEAICPSRKTIADIAEEYKKKTTATVAPEVQAPSQTVIAQQINNPMAITHPMSSSRYLLGRKANEGRVSEEVLDRARDFICRKTI